MKKLKRIVSAILALSLVLGANTIVLSAETLTKDRKEATPHTIEANKKVAGDKTYFQGLEKEYANASEGLITKGKGYLVSEKDPNKRIWDMTKYDFLLEENYPDTVNPALWDEARLNAHYGLFKVAEGIYQVRGYDVANISFIATDSGWFVFDTGATTEAAAYAYELISEHVGERPIKAVCTLIHI